MSFNCALSTTWKHGGGGGLCPLASRDISDTDPSLQLTARSMLVLLPARWSEAPLRSDSTLEIQASQAGGLMRDRTPPICRVSTVSLAGVGADF